MGVMGYGYASTPQFSAPLVNVYFSPPFPLLPSYTHILYTVVRFGLELRPFGDMGCPFSPFYVSYFFSYL